MASSHKPVYDFPNPFTNIFPCNSNILCSGGGLDALQKGIYQHRSHKIHILGKTACSESHVASYF